MRGRRTTASPSVPPPPPAAHTTPPPFLRNASGPSHGCSPTPHPPPAAPVGDPTAALHLPLSPAALVGGPTAAIHPSSLPKLYYILPTSTTYLLVLPTYLPAQWCVLHCQYCTSVTPPLLPSAAHLQVLHLTEPGEREPRRCPAQVVLPPPCPSGTTPPPYPYNPSTPPPAAPPGR